MSSYECLLKCGKPCTSGDTIGKGRWQSLQSKAKNWSGLDKFGDTYDSTAWENGPQYYYMHRACYITISSDTKLEQAKNRRKKEEIVSDESFCGASSSAKQSISEVSRDEERDEPTPPKRLRSSIDGPTHEQSKCVWCKEREDKKHPDRKLGKLYRINILSAWRSFKRHVVLIEETELKERLAQLVESTSALSDPFANDIMYHHACWQKCVSHVGRGFKKDAAMHLHNVNLTEARSTFFKHVDDVIFTEHEIRSLQSLLDDYKRIVGDYGYAVGEMK